MADRKANIPSSSANLLFSGAPEFNFSLPFLPVSQATGPAVLSGDDASEVGEEDSFLGQTSSAAPQASTFNYFSSVTNSSDPFASIGQQPCPPPAATVVPSTTGPSPVSIAASLPLNPPVSHMNPSQQYGSVANQTPVGTYTPPPNVPTPPPPQSSQQSYNPYRHTAASSKANPYLMAPELQQQTPSQTPQHLNPYSQAIPAPSFQTPPTVFNKPPPTQIPPPPAATSMAGPLVPANSMMPYTYNVYEPVQHHWFYCKQVESKMVWLPFSILDSIRLEETFNSVQPDPENVIVCTDGGRYDVQLYDRTRTSVYWEEEPTEVRRCSWFYKGDADSRFIPYSEEFSEKLEVEYKKAVTTNQWHRRLEFPSGETIVMHNPKVIVQFQPSAMPDEWGTTQDGQTRPRVVKRGVDDDQDEVPDGEMAQVDHLVFMVHGIGPVCDLRFRSMVECVDDFRSVSLKLLQSHFKKARDDHVISRVEFLPVHWHTALHGDATGVDRRIKKITLPSTGRLRHFTNETLLDVLFYNSPTYCQTIMDTVAFEINRLHALFMARNPDFKGRVSVSGHSLGSLILFDLLSNQKVCSPLSGPVTNGNAPPNVKQGSPVIQANEVATVAAAEEEAKEEEEEEEIGDLSSVLEMLCLSEYLSVFETERIDIESLLLCTIDDLKEMGIPLGPRKKLANFVKEKSAKQAARKAVKEKTVEKEEPKETKPPVQTEPTPDPSISKLPVGRNMSSIHVDYNYFEIGTGQVSVVYHALDFEPVNFFALGSPIGMFLTVRGVEKIEESYQLPTCKGFFNIYHPLDPVAYRIEPLILPDIEMEPVLIPHHKGRKRLHLELKESLSRMGSDLKHGFISSLKTAWQTLNEFARAHTSSTQLHEQLAMVASQIKAQEEMQEEESKMVESPEPQKEEETHVQVGLLNGGNRIDYVLQEKPIESFNEYLFALQSHLCYWESEDTALLLLKEIYKSMDVRPDHPVH
ncbi:SEC23-interacting protein isoform X2 [Pimephales promelas]|uniref:SEC23-interacting protein isoform X2 n=1 Tax=Pimephales promelas TaxID=90988 RepID=UPI001955F191|nr:SEC23-interacting protein isoform X2 [Pimephales promelas]KAG1951072.1 phospholipase DDHD2 [Pimephales promelas]